MTDKNGIRTVDILAYEISEDVTYAHILRFKTRNPTDATMKIDFTRAVADYIQTPEGQSCLRETCGNFNWGEIPNISNEILAKYGYELVDIITPDYVFDLNESLLPGGIF